MILESYIEKMVFHFAMFIKLNFSEITFFIHYFYFFEVKTPRILYWKEGTDQGLPLQED